MYPKRGHIESMFLKETKKEDVFADHSNKFGNLKDVKTHNSTKACGHE